MKLAITNETEIKDLMNICLELEEFSKELNTKHLPNNTFQINANNIINNSLAQKRYKV